MKNRTSLFYSILLLFFVLLYVFLEYEMYNAENGLGLGVALIYLGIILVHCILLIASYIVRKLKDQLGGEMLFIINVILVLFLLFRLLVLIWIS